MFNKKQLNRIELSLRSLENRMFSLEIKITSVEDVILELMKSSTKEIQAINTLAEEISNIYKVLSKALELQQSMESPNVPRNQMN